MRTLTETTVETPFDRMLPMVSAALLVGDAITSSTSLKGDGEPSLHPLVDRFLRDLPVEHREVFRFHCAEAALISDEIAELEQGHGAVGWARVRAHFSGAKIAPSLVREHGDPAHGAFAKPCKSCSRLLAFLGIEVLEP